jgi:hypothetical protein
MNKVSVVVHQLLGLLKVPATLTTITETLASHPYYPSLLAVRDTLLSLKVPNASYNLETSQLSELPTPCIVHLKEGKKEEFTVIKSINQTEVVHLKDSRTWVVEPTVDFEKRWTGVVMLAEAQVSSGEAQYKKERFKELIYATRLPLLFTLLVMIVIVDVFSYLSSSAPWQWWLLFCVRIIGVLLGTSLVVDLFNNNTYLKKICSINTQFDCSSTLKSDQLKLGGVISWSELVLVYYAGSFLWMSLSHQYQFLFTPLCYLNLAALPFTVYSLYYQIIKQKKACLICLMVILLLWLETYILLPYFWHGAINIYTIYIGLISFLIPITIWSIIKPWVEKLQATSQQLDLAMKLKKDPSIFSTILKMQEKIAPL